MKYAIIIPDGAADEPLKELGGKTPFEAANTPNMDRIAMEGRQGTARTVPEGFESGSDVATMCLLGYDPKVYHTGRAPLEAAAQQIPLSPTDWVFRCNLVTVVDGIMKDHSAGGITNAEAAQLHRRSGKALDIPEFEFHIGVSYRNLLVYRGQQEFDVTTKPPHEIPDEPIDKWMPQGWAPRSSSRSWTARAISSPITRSTRSAARPATTRPRKSGSGARATHRTCRNSPSASASKPAA